ncbi:putative cytochrome P450 monooxygenase [Ascobolus immersus RN42]|uniref:Putative cytochrome P450 monooxygenase n=1 Tax=Ascobolus immersus RN42 TaxID=1160509 RepID=A0A3N4IUL6_ASCIM|nr:putative cytochrome P450 monooxygenase [Ascobolus immersus RN42]
MALLGSLNLTDALPALRITLQQHWFSILIFLFATRIIYLRYFHPLAKFPGPFWGSITDLYSCYIYLTKEQHLRELELHKKYGPIVRYKPNLVLVDDPNYLPVIYHKHVDKTAFQKASGLGFSSAVVSALPHKEHAALKKRVAPSFTMTNIRGMEGAVDTRVREWITRIDQDFAQKKMAMDFGPWSQYYAYDVVSELAFGKPFGFVKAASDVAGLIHSLHITMPGAGILQRIPSLADVLSLPILEKKMMPNPTDKTGIGAIMGFRNKLIRKRIESGESGSGENGVKDILGHLLAYRDENGNGISEEDLNSELMIVLLAGSDTTAAAFRNFLKHILGHPDVYKRLQAELDEAYDSGKLSSPPNYDEILELKYFLACIKESMRHEAPVPSHLPRMVSEPGYNIAGHFIPGGAEIGCNAWVTARHKTFGEDAHLFNPDRYYNASEKELIRLDKLDYVWGYGSRACLGRNLAQVELYKILCEFFRRFKPSWTVAPEGQEPKEMTEENFGIWIQFGLWTNVERRDVKEWKYSY